LGAAAGASSARSARLPVKPRFGARTEGDDRARGQGGEQLTL
jgi:hypothetical protein